MNAPERRSRGTLALIGGGEFDPACLALDRELLAASAGDQVTVIPTAAAFEHPDRIATRADSYFRELGARVRTVRCLNRRDAEADALVKAAKGSSFVYVCDGSPMHLRSVLKGSSLFAVIEAAYRSGAVLAASGAGATVLCDPMVDPRGGAYTVGLGIVRNLAVFPYHGTAADHLRERSLELLPKGATLAGLDEHTALVRDPKGTWRAVGPGNVTLYRGGSMTVHHDAVIESLRA